MRWNARCWRCAPPGAASLIAGEQSGALQLTGSLGHRRFAVRRLVAVDHALAHGLVQLTAGSLQLAKCPVLLAGGGGFAKPANRSLERRFDGFVAQSRLL